MACVPSEVAALADRLHLLAMLAANPAAMQGLTAVVRAGRRNGLNTATFAGVTLTVSSPPGAEKAQVRSKKGSTDNGRPRAPATGSRAPTPHRRGRKSAAQQKRDAERYAAKRMGHKFVPVMHLVSKFVHEQQQQQLLSVDVEELPQFREPPAGTPGTSQAMQVAQQRPLQPESECRRLDCNAQRVDSPATATMAGCKHGISSPSRPTGRDGSPAEQPPKRFSEYSNRGRNGEAARLRRQLEANMLPIGGCSGRDQPG